MTRTRTLEAGAVMAFAALVSQPAVAADYELPPFELASFWGEPASEMDAKEGNKSTGNEELTPQERLQQEWLKEGILSVRVLDRDTLEKLKLEASSAGEDASDLYPTSGPMVVAALPVKRLVISDMRVVLPRLCEVTVDRAPHHWAVFSEVRILTKDVHSTHTFDAVMGWGFEDFAEVCNRLHGSNEPAVPNLYFGRWGGALPWSLAKPWGRIGYGEGYKLIDTTDPPQAGS